jgi:hypothetical protein
MSRCSQTNAQFSAWIKKNRWEPLLNWFNQNETDVDSWTTLLAQAQRYDIEQKWPQYLDFFQKHMDAKVGNKQFLSSWKASSGNQEKAFKLFEVAIPVFFLKAAPLLSVEQQRDFRKTVMTWFEPWLKRPRESQSITQRNFISTVFRTLSSFDAFDEWRGLESFVDKHDMYKLVLHTIGKDIRWANALRDLHLSHGHDEGSWRLLLLKGDCIEHLLAETTAFPVAKTLFIFGAAEQEKNNKKAEEVLRPVFMRYPHFRMWATGASGRDAQTCRAALGLPEIDSCVCSEASAVSIGKSLGLSLVEIAELLYAQPLERLPLFDNNLFDAGC